MVKPQKNISFRKQIKSFFAFGIFILFFSQVFWLNIYFEIKRFQIKKEVKQKIFDGIPLNELTIITKDLSFNEMEFRFNGKMYDVVRIVKYADKQLLYCFEDNHETELAKNIEDQIHNTLNDHPSQKSKQKLIDFLKIKFLPNEDFLFKKVFTNKEIALYPKKIEVYSTIISVNSPPPKGVQFHDSLLIAMTNVAPQY